jgi:hypothetical protein
MCREVAALDEGDNTDSALGAVKLLACIQRTMKMIMEIEHRMQSTGCID